MALFLKTTSISSLYHNKLGRFFLTEEGYLHNGFKDPYRGGPVKRVSEEDLQGEDEKIEYLKSIPEAKLYRGLLLHGYFISPKFLRQLDSFKIREDDVLLATYPRSGTTWTEEILSCLYYNGEFDRLKNKELYFRVHHLEVGLPFNQHGWLRSLKSPRLLATHLALSHCPHEIQDLKCKIIYVVRNPKDNMVSYYHFHGTAAFLGKTSHDWNKFYKSYVNGYLVYGSWFEHVKGWWKLAKDHPDKVLFISYEELYLNLPKMIEKIADFVGRPQIPQVIEDIAEHCSFYEMKKNQMVNREKIPIRDLLDQSKSKFMRKGIIGDWKNYFSQDQNADFDRIYREFQKEFDYELIFDIETEIENQTKTSKVL